MRYEHKLQVLAMLGGDDKMELSYMTVATTAVMFKRSTFDNTIALGW